MFDLNKQQRHVHVSAVVQRTDILHKLCHMDTEYYTFANFLVRNNKDSNDWKDYSSIPHNA